MIDQDLITDIRGAFSADADALSPAARNRIAAHDYHPRRPLPRATGPALGVAVVCAAAVGAVGIAGLDHQPQHTAMSSVNRSAAVLIDSQAASISTSNQTSGKPFARLTVQIGDARRMIELSKVSGHRLRVDLMGPDGTTIQRTGYVPDKGRKLDLDQALKAVGL